MRSFITSLSTASLVTTVLAQAPFPIMTASAAGPILSKIESDVMSYISGVYNAPAWTSASMALATAAPNLARDQGVNGDPISLVQAFLVATATPTWYTALPTDIQNFIYRVAADEASIAVKDDVTSSAVFAGTTDSASSGTSVSESNPSITNAGNSQSSSGWDSMPIGAKIGIIFGAIVAVSIIVFLGWCVWRRERRDRFDRMIAAKHQSAPGYDSGYDSGYSPGQTTYLPSSYLSPSAQPLKSSSPIQKPGYAPSEYYPVTEVDWQHENKEPRYAGSELGASDIANWRDEAHTIIAPTQR